MKRIQKVKFLCASLCSIDRHLLHIIIADAQLFVFLNFLKTVDFFILRIKHKNRVGGFDKDIFAEQKCAADILAIYNEIGKK